MCNPMRNPIRNLVRKILAALIVVITIGLYPGVRPAQAQDESKPKANPIAPYRLDFSLDELQDGKKINTRHYTSQLVAGQENDIRIGLRVPVVSSDKQGEKEYQYLDVGTTIKCDSRERGDDIELIVNAEVSDFDTAATSTSAAPYLAPIIRQVKIGGRVLLIAGKPILVGSVDDPNSKRQFQLEVVATKLR
jgi:hypothetical protein